MKVRSAYRRLIKDPIVRTRCILMLLLCLSGTTIAGAGVDVITVTVEGRGPSLPEAVSAGLALAVSQVHGMELQVEAVSHRSAQEVVSNSEAVETYSEESSSWVRSTSRGLVTGFSILDKSMDGTFHRVSLEVQLPRLRASVSTQRVRAAVAGFSKGSSVKSFGAVRLLEDRIAMYLTQTRRFSVLDRASSAAVNRERDRVRSPDVTHLERVRLGQELASDLLLTGELEQFEARQESFTFGSGRTVRQFYPEGRLSLRVVDVATGETRFARKVERSMEAVQDMDQRWPALLADSLAQEAVRSVLDAIFPIAILHVGSGSVYLNTGGDVLKVGELLDVYAMEAQLLDPYTGERLGPIEHRVGQIRVHAVNDKQAVAEIIEGGDAVREGCICRPRATTGPTPLPSPESSSSAGPERESDFSEGVW